jgi:hypothetical protein
MQCGERVIFPAVRDASPATLLLADGFSCRSQIEQGTGREAKHLAQVIRDALQGGDGSPGAQTQSPAKRQNVTLAAFAAAAVVAGAAGAARRRVRVNGHGR